MKGFEFSQVVEKMQMSSTAEPVDPDKMPHIVIARLQEEVARELWGEENT